MSLIEKIKQMGKSGELAPPIAKLIGFEVLSVEEGKVVLEMEATEAHHNPMGTMHGGVLGDLADAALGYAFSTTLNDDQLFSSVDLKINFLKPVFIGKLRAEGKLIRRGAQIGLLECEIYDESDSLVAHATSTCMVLENMTSGKREEKK